MKIGDAQRGEPKVTIEASAAPTGPNGKFSTADVTGNGEKWVCTKIKEYKLTVPVSFGVKFKAGAGTKGEKFLKKWLEASVKSDGTFATLDGDVSFEFEGSLRLKSRSCPSCIACQSAVDKKRTELKNR